jgi:hypothetical protein
MFVRERAMFFGGGGVVLGLIVFAAGVVVLGLMMVMRGRVVVARRGVMMLLRRMFCHSASSVAVISVADVRRPPFPVKDRRAKVQSGHGTSVCAAEQRRQR